MRFLVERQWEATGKNLCFMLLFFKKIEERKLSKEL